MKHNLKCTIHRLLKNLNEHPEHLQLLNTAKHKYFPIRRKQTSQNLRRGKTHVDMCYATHVDMYTVFICQHSKYVHGIIFLGIGKSNESSGKMHTHSWFDYISVGIVQGWDMMYMCLNTWFLICHMLSNNEDMSVLKTVTTCYRGEKKGISIFLGW